MSTSLFVNILKIKLKFKTATLNFIQYFSIKLNFKSKNFLTSAVKTFLFDLLRPPALPKFRIWQTHLIRIYFHKIKYRQMDRAIILKKWWFFVSENSTNFLFFNFTSHLLFYDIILQLMQFRLIIYRVKKQTIYSYETLIMVRSHIMKQNADIQEGISQA